MRDPREVLERAYKSVRLLPQYIPHRPTPKQRLFLMMPHREVLFGGRAGGGKSDALLMAALQYVDVPGYAAIIFRKTFTDLSLPGALIDRSKDWLTGKARWNSTQHKWLFASGAVLQFGYLQDKNDKYRYQSSEYHFVGFDELTQFEEEDYTYLFSRMRRVKNFEIPLRFRAATNPGNVGHQWVKRRWDIGPQVINGKTCYVGRNKNRPFIPSTLADNPYLDEEEYADSLRELDPVTREQLLNGDWGVKADGRFKLGWMKYFSERGPIYITLGKDGSGQVVDRHDCECFMVVDPAASSAENPSSSAWKKKTSRSVVAAFARTLHHNHLLWLDCRVGQWEIPTLVENIVEMARAHQPTTIGIEASGLGIGIVTACENAGLPIKRLHPKSKDKLSRATDAMNRMEAGKVWLPQTAPWLEEVQSELFGWTAHPDEPDDIVDVLSYAAMNVTEVAYDYAEMAGTEQIMLAIAPKVLNGMDEYPTVDGSSSWTFGGITGGGPF